MKPAINLLATHIALAMGGAARGGEIAIDNEGEPLTQMELDRVFCLPIVNQLSVIS
jgi:hypothetical protein